MRRLQNRSSTTLLLRTDLAAFFPITRIVRTLCVVGSWRIYSGGRKTGGEGTKGIRSYDEHNHSTLVDHGRRFRLCAFFLPRNFHRMAGAVGVKRITPTFICGGTRIPGSNICVSFMYLHPVLRERIVNGVPWVAIIRIDVKYPSIPDLEILRVIRCLQFHLPPKN